MNESTEYDALVESIVDALDGDVVGLWEIPEDLRSIFGLTDPEVIHRTTMQIVEKILSHPGVVFGQFEVGIFQPWKLPAVEILKRIDDEWEKLGRAPKLLEIGWFAKEGTESYYWV